MKTEELREKIKEIAGCEIVFFDNLSFDNSIIGLTHDNKVAYLFSKMIEETKEQLNCNDTDAIEWLEHNTIRALSYFGHNNKPVIIYDLEY